MKKLAIMVLLCSQCFAGDVVSTKMIDALVKIESSGDPEAVGAANERGLLQLTHAAWVQAMGRRAPWEKAFDPHLNVVAGTIYLRHLESELRRAIPGWNRLPKKLRTELVLIAWNAGLKAAVKHFRHGKCPRSTYRFVLKFWRAYG